LGLTLRYPYEVRNEAEYFEDIPELKLSKEMLDLATHIINSKSGHFDPGQFEDRYESALVELLKKKEAGEKIEPTKAGPTPRVVNLMDALRASLETLRAYVCSTPNSGARTAGDVRKRKRPPTEAALLLLG